MVEGACLCGAVRWAFDGELGTFLNCHCSMCRKHHGTPFAAFAAGPAGGLRWLAGEESIATYRSSGHGLRSFCRTCGSKVPVVIAEVQLAFMPAGNLTGELGVRPQMHIFVGSKASWYTIADSLPQHEAFPPEFGAAGVERPAPQVREGRIAGSCLCGDVAYEIDAPPLRMFNCHCSRCRRARSNAHATNAFYSLSHFRWLRGEERLEDYSLPGARYFGTCFCSRCGSMMPRTSKERGLVVVPAGSLDTDPGMRPLAHIFVGSKASWFEIADAVPRFDGMPPAA